jgi:hypothetical protein
MSIKVEVLRKYIREIIKQELKLQEASATGAIDGGEGPPKTPNAFQSKRKKDKEKEDKIAKQSGYSIAESINEITLGQMLAKQGKKIKMVKKPGGGFKMTFVPIDEPEPENEPVTEALKSKSNVVKLAGAVMDNMIDLVDYEGNDYDKAVNTFGTMIKNSLERISRMNIKPHPQYDYSDKRSAHPMIKDEKSHLKFLKDYKKLTKKLIPLFKALINKPSKPGIVKVMKYYNSSKYQEMNSVIATGDFGNNHVIESVNEGKYHDYRNDDTLNAKQKIGMSMREVRDKLNELDKLVKMNVRLKNEVGVNSTDYWKNTHNAMKKISERLVKLANKVGQLY